MFEGGKYNRSDRKCGISPHLGHYNPSREKHQTKRSNLFQQHRTHCGEKPFQCVQCNKAFARNNNLTAHLRTHSGEKPFQCVQCNKAFAEKHSLTRHLRTHSGEKPFQCVRCEKAFARKPDFFISELIVEKNHSSVFSVTRRLHENLI